MAAVTTSTALLTGLMMNRLQNQTNKSKAIAVMEELWKDKSKAPGPQWSKVKTNTPYAKEALDLAKQIWSSHEAEIKKSGTTQSKRGTFSINKNDEVYLAQEGVPANYRVINGRVVYTPHGKWYDLKSETWKKLGLTDDSEGQLTVDQFKKAFPQHWRSPSDIHNLTSGNVKLNRINANKLKFNNKDKTEETVDSNSLKINDNTTKQVVPNEQVVPNDQVVPNEQVVPVEQKEKLTRPEPWARGRGSLNKADNATMAYLRQEGFGGAVDSLRGPSLRELLRDIRTDRTFMPNRRGNQYLHFGGKVYKAER